MVAYSFAPQFADAVAALEKRQTVRGHRRRHAQPGEPVQLFTGMRTHHCRKLVTPDPICVDVRLIAIEIERALPIVVRMEIAGIALNDYEIAAFAAADGFGPVRKARQRMGAFWLTQHGHGPWEGVVIRWQPRSDGEAG